MSWMVGCRPPVGTGVPGSVTSTGSASAGSVSTSSFSRSASACSTSCCARATSLPTRLRSSPDSVLIALRTCSSVPERPSTSRRTASTSATDRAPADSPSACSRIEASRSRSSVPVSVLLIPAFPHPDRPTGAALRPGIDRIEPLERIWQATPPDAREPHRGVYIGQSWFSGRAGHRSRRTPGSPGRRRARAPAGRRRTARSRTRRRAGCAGRRRHTARARDRRRVRRRS